MTPLTLRPQKDSAFFWCETLSAFSFRAALQSVFEYIPSVIQTVAAGCPYFSLRFFKSCKDRSFNGFSWIHKSIIDCRWRFGLDRYSGDTLQSRTGPEQDFPCVLILPGKNLFSLQGTQTFHCREPVFITGISLRELVHREITVVITGNGFAV